MYLCRQGDREHAGGARAACCDCGVPSRCAQRCRGETLAHRPAAAHARREPRAAAAAVRRPCPLASGQYPLLGPLRAGAPVIGPRPAPKSTTHSVEPLLSRSRPSCADRPLLKSASDGSMPSALPPAPCIGLLERLEGRSDGLRPPQPASATACVVSAQRLVPVYRLPWRADEAPTRPGPGLWRTAPRKPTHSEASLSETHTMVMCRPPALGERRAAAAGARTHGRPPAGGRSLRSAASLLMPRAALPQPSSITQHRPPHGWRRACCCCKATANIAVARLR